MSCLVRCKDRVFSSCFLFEIYKHIEDEKGYSQLLIVERSKDEIVYIFHEFSEIKRNGFFIECFSFGEGLWILDSFLKNIPAEELIPLMPNRENVKKVVQYQDPYIPWFYNRNNKLIKEDVFIFS